MSTRPLRPGTSYSAVVGGVLAKLREEKSLRQNDVAEAVKVTQATWSRIENGSSAATIEHLALAADAIGIAPHEIVKLADQSVEALREQGIEVERTREASGLDSGIALVAAAVLGALLAAVLVKSKNAHETEPSETGADNEG